MHSRISRKIEATLAFALMKFAWQRFGKMVVELTTDEYAEAYQQACAGKNRLCRSSHAFA